MICCFVVIFFFSHFNRVVLFNIFGSSIHLIINQTSAQLNNNNLISKSIVQLIHSTNSFNDFIKIREVFTLFRLDFMCVVFVSYSLSLIFCFKLKFRAIQGNTFEWGKCTRIMFASELFCSCCCYFFLIVVVTCKWFISCIQNC